MGAAGTGSPLFPAGYVAGTIVIPASVPTSLLALIQAQLDPNCPGAGQEVNLQTDASGAVYVGRESKLGGALSSTNYGYMLASGGASRTYRTSFPGASSPVGDLQVYSTGGGNLHVEVLAG